MSESTPYEDARFAEQILARHQQLVGRPPRILPVDRADASEQVRLATGQLRSNVVGDAADLAVDQIPEIMFTLCRFPDLWERIMALSIHMQGATGVLAARDRQLAILRTAWLLQAPYEWAEHVRHSKKVGITSEEIARVREGSAGQGWSDHEAALLRAAEELREDAFVSDGTWVILSRQLSDHQLFELMVLVGQFTTVAYFQNSLRLRLEGAGEGLSAV